MPKSDVTASDKVPEEHQSDFVLDFLYNDARRVGSFLSQFDDSGALDRIVQRESATKGQKRGMKFQISGGGTVLGTGANAGLGFDRGPGDSGSESLERQYDPLWTNALTLLDMLTVRSLIKNNVARAGMGQFVRVTGSLQIHDLDSLKAMWELPLVKRQMGAGQPKKPNKAGGGVNELELGLEMMKVLPHGVTARMRSTGLSPIETWSSLSPEFITGSTSDLFLKHGARISGQWTMVGVLDAEPNLITTTDYTPEQNNVLFSTNGLGHILDLIAPMARAFLGRPSGAYGITPLVIFREVSR